MNQILTNDEIIAAINPLCNTDEVAKHLIGVSMDEYRAIEQAILNKLSKQEPFGYYENGRWSIVTDGGPDKWRARKEYTGPLYTRPAPSVPTQVTCQLYGHVVGACDECNTHTEKDVNETNKVLADNYLKLTCGIAPSVPEGYQLVPIEPTEAMIQAGKDVPCEAKYGSDVVRDSDYVRVFKAMLSATRSE